MIRVNRSSLILLIALILGCIWDQLFYGQVLGISVPLFVLLLLVALFGLGLLERAWPKWRNLWLLAPLLFFAAMVFVRANRFVTFLNVSASLTLLGLVAHFYSAGRIEELGLLDYPRALARTGAGALARPAPLVSSSVDLRAAGKRGPDLLPVARGCLLALPVLAVFTAFLASADLVFASYVQDLSRLEFLPDLSEWAWRGTIVLGVAWIVAGGLAHAIQRRRVNGDAAPGEKAPDGLSRTFPLGFVEAATLLVALDLLFLVFVWIQFAYLFGGRANITVEGYTYAEYARRGFFELLAVSVLALGLIVALHRYTPRETVGRKDIFAGLSSLMVLLVLVILASAFQRLLLYEDAFGYTQLRLYSHVFMIWLGFTFVWFLVVLWRQSKRFALGVFLAVLGFLITLNALNPDAFIAEQNLVRYRTTGKLDLPYLTTLSEDVVPVLVRSRDWLAAADCRTLDDHLQHRLQQMEENTRWRNWPSFHLSRQRAYDLLADGQWH